MSHGARAAALDAAGASKQVQQAVQAFATARSEFVHTISEMVARKDGGVTLEALMRADILALLCCPVVQDSVDGIQINALSALGTLAKQDPAIASAITASGILSTVVLSLLHDNVRIQATANRTLHSVASSDEKAAEKIMDAGAVDIVKGQLGSNHLDVKEAAVWTTSAFVLTGPECASEVMDTAFIADMVHYLDVPETPQSLNHAILTTLAATADHNVELAQRIVETDPIGPAVALLKMPRADAFLKTSSCRFLSQIAKHSDELASQVVAAKAVPPVLQAMTDTQYPALRAAAASVLHEASRRTIEMANVIVNAGGPACVVRHLQLEGGTKASRVGTLCLGHIASFSGPLAKAVVDAQAPQCLVSVLQSRSIESVTAAAWAVEKIAAHGKESALPLAEAGVLPTMTQLYARHASSDEAARARLKAALKAVIRGCRTLAALQPMVDASTPPDILKTVLSQFAEYLKDSVTDRRAFVTSGALMRLQAVEPALDDKGKEHVGTINEQFPEDVVAYYRS